jgi:hypothetical protein
MATPSHEAEVSCPNCASLLVLPDGTCAQCGASVPASLQHAPTLVVPDSIEPVSGWRAWNLRMPSGYEIPGMRKPWWADEPEDGPILLESVTHNDTVWLPREEVVAKCSRGGRGRARVGKPLTGRPSTESHPVPSEDCTCGLYAARTLDHLLGMRYPQYDPDLGQYTVIGEVALWGGVVEGTQGWRAERAYPTVLYLPFLGWKYAKRLNDTYGVPVRLKNWLGESFRPVE